MNDAEKELVERLFAEVERLQAIVEEDNEVLRNSIDTIAGLRIQNKMLWKYVDAGMMYDDGLLTIEGELIEDGGEEE